MTSLEPLKAPFPYFGGKSMIADQIWQAIGDVANYIEPFCGSCAVLLNRPHEPKIETVNDKDCMIANFWRALSKDPDGVSDHADWPVNEVDLEARHAWLVKQKDSLRDFLSEPEYYDCKIAGWWCWGQCCWIGSGWCSGEGPWQRIDGRLQKLSNAGRGINRQLPHLSRAGQGINRKRPHLSDAGNGINRQLEQPIQAYMHQLADRLRNVRVCCGDWQRICGPAVTFKHGLTGVFLDPPYANNIRTTGLYGEDCGNVAAEVTAWAVANGANPLMRIVVAGYDGEHNILESHGWRVIEWKASAGYQSQDKGNAELERLWCSPACLTGDAPAQGSLLDDL